MHRLLDGTLCLHEVYAMMCRRSAVSTSQVTKVRNFPRFTNRGDFLWGISEEFLENHFLQLIPRKFSRNSLELVPKIRDFCGITVMRLSFEKFLRNSPELFPTKFLRISPEIFSGNSWEILRTLSPCLRIFWGIY